MFLEELALELAKYLNINEYAINLEKNKLFYRLIYSFRLVKEEILKIYIKNNLVNSFIALFKSFAKVFILFIKKLDNNFYLCINY